MATLVIVESPAKARTIGQYLGPGYTVMATMGHLRDLPKSGKGMDEAFTLEYVPIAGKRPSANCGRQRRKAIPLSSRQTPTARERPFPGMSKSFSDCLTPERNG